MKSAVLAALMLAAIVLPPVAGADGGDDGAEARTRVACAGGHAELRLKARDSDDHDEQLIEIELRVDIRGTQSFRIVLLHERTLVFSGVRRTRAGALRLRWAVADWPWSETITARLGTRSGRTCHLAAAI